MLRQQSMESVEKNMETTIKVTDPRVKRTRQLIQQAFMDLLHEKSFQSLTVQDIAEKATINRATFYAHFVDKYALLDECIRAGFHQALAKRLPASAPLTKHHLRQLILAVCDFLPMGRGHCTPSDLQLEPRFETMVQQSIYVQLVNWLQPLSFVEPHEHVSHETIATVLSWGIFGAGVDWSQGESKFSAEDFADQVMVVVLNALARTFRISGLE